jgi:dolichol-phosphate mannosyltransferase
MTRRKDRPTVGMVIPCYNEEDVIPQLVEEIKVFASKLDLPCRFLFVDDGSRDRTVELISEACQGDSRFGYISFSRNFGHQTAVSAGLRHAEGDIVAVIDADLQDPPEVIVEMIRLWRQGYDVIYGVRRNRKEHVLLRVAYTLFYRLLKGIAHTEIPLDAGDFSLMDRKVVDHINRMPEHNRFVRGLRGWVGFRQIGLPYERAERQAGAPKYNLVRLSKLALDGLISFSSVPLRLAAWVGAVSSVLGFGLLIWAFVSAFVLKNPPPGWASLAVMLLFFGGVQLLILGAIGEYIGRIFEEVKRRPLYVVREVIEGKDSPQRRGDAEKKKEAAGA